MRNLTPQEELGYLSHLARGIFGVVLGYRGPQDVDLSAPDPALQNQLRQKFNLNVHLVVAMREEQTGHETIAQIHGYASNLEIVLAKLDVPQERAIRDMVPEKQDQRAIARLAQKHNLPEIARVFGLSNP